MSTTNLSDAELRTQVEHRLDTGLLDVWHPVLPGWKLRSQPIGITRLGKQIVLWRDQQGVAHAVEDRCPHRGARLSLGWNLGDRIACWYHGVEVNGAGEIVNVPAANTNCAMGDTRSVRCYPVEERHGAVFVFFGATASTPPCELALPEELESEAYSSFLCVAHWRVNYRYAIDNVMDPMHGAYLHAASHSMAMGDKRAEMQVRTTDTGLVFEKTTQRDVNFDWVEWGESGAYWMRLAIPYQPKFGPGGPFGIVGFATPVDAENTMVFFWRTRKVIGWQRAAWRFLYKTRLEALHWTVLEQDREVLESMPSDARRQEFLYEHDIGLSQVRRRMQRAARANVLAEHTA